MKSRGIDLPDDVEWYVAEDEGMTVREAGLKLRERDAIYFRRQLLPSNASTPVEWEELKSSGKVSIFLGGRLESEDHVLYVLAHEVFEITQLRTAFEERGGTMTLENLAYLIEPSLRGVIHEDAVRYADAFVQTYRAEKGFER